MPRTISIRNSLLFLTVVFTVFLAGGNALGQSCSAPSFTQPPIYPAGSNVKGLAAADFDGDGHSDVAIADVNSDSLTVFANLAQNTPVSTNSYTIGRLPFAVAAGDLNGDGKPDLVTADTSSFSLSILLNDGTGHFLPATAITGIVAPQAIALGDFNADTKLDIATIGGFSENVTVLLGNGMGGFGLPSSFQAGQQPRQITTGDFNVDNKLDLAITIQTGTQILFGDGAGAFATGPSPCSPATGGDGLAAGDLNGDAKPDLVIANILAAQIFVLINNGSGCFGPPTGIGVLNEGRPGVITLRDLNGDTKLDIIAGTTILIGNGSGGFGTPFQYGTGSVGSNTATGDFDGDGKIDIASAGGGSLTILRGDGAGGIKNAAGAVARGVFGAARADMNSDGKLDLVYFTSNTANIVLGDGNGGFGAPTLFPLSNIFLISPVIADFNNDTKLDVAGLDFTNNGPGGSKRIIVLAGNGAGSLGPPIATNFTANEPGALAGGDFNGDMNFDLITVNRIGISTTDGAVGVLLGDGTGHFSAPTEFAVNVGVNVKQVGVADLNGDNKLDLAVPSGFGFSTMLGNGLGSFGPATHSTTANSSSIVIADFNGDGKRDLAMVNGEPNNKLAVVLGDGTGGFGAPTLFNIGTFPGDLTAADFNGDTTVDIAVANLNAAGTLSSVSVLLGNGAGNFAARTDYLVERAPGQILSGDLNGDSKVDIVTAHNDINTFSVLINTCGSPVSSTPTIQFSSSMYSVDEGAQTATITVTRSGDTTNAASVKYATSDGVASSRADYITSLGTLRFGPGETTKSFIVLIVDDSRAGEANESLNIKLSAPVGATLGNPSSAILSILENDQTTTTINPIDSDTFFVRQHYFDFLNRAPDALGLQFWANQISECDLRPEPERAPCREVRRVNVSAAFFLSIEFQETGYLTYRTYKTAYGDATSPNVPGTVPIVRLNEFIADSQQLGLNVVVGVGNWEQQLAENKVAYTRQFVNEQRFLTAFPLSMTPGAFVDKLNLNAGNVLTQLERDQLVMQLTGASDVTVGRAAVLQQVAENRLLHERELNRAFVLMQYFGYLRRNPDDPQDTDFRGWKFWLDKLNLFNGNFVDAEMVKAFILSIEYRERFN